MPNEELPIPFEIPWKLAATTQMYRPAVGSTPEKLMEDTSIAVFVFEPTGEVLDNYPDHRLLYFKVAASISPYKPNEETFNELALSVLEDGLPVSFASLNMLATDRSPTSGPINVAATMNPHFLAAAPMRRSMLETGVIGAELYEGAADGVAIGKSASEVHETLSSHATTKTSGGGGGFGIDIFGVRIGGNVSGRSTSTAVDSERDVNQYLETTTRDASQERRELLSHTTNIKNVLTLLTAKHIGSPYLNFALWPRPLQVLSVDPSDENLWFNQLIHRRSSGIDGIQEFFAVLAVLKKMTKIQLRTTLTRVAVLDNISTLPRMIGEEYTPDMFRRIDEYLYDRYPPGTPIEDLDLDLDPQIKFYRPIVRCWLVGNPDQTNSQGQKIEDRSIMVIIQDAGKTTSKALTYKRVEEVWLEVYEHELSRSPLERGVILSDDLQLSLNIDLTQSGSPKFSSSEISIQPATTVHFNARQNRRLGEPYRGHSTDIHRRVGKTTDWATLEGQFVQGMFSRQPREGVTSTDRSVITELVFERYANIDADDPRNLTLDEALRLNLLTPQEYDLAKGFAADLRGLAQATTGTLQIEMVLQRKERCTKLAGLGYKPPKTPVAPHVAMEVTKTFGNGIVRTSPK